MSKLVAIPDQKKEKMLLLQTTDKETFEVEESVALQSQTLKHMVEDGCADSIIPLPNVTSKTLAKIIEYCKRHVEVDADDDKSQQNLNEFDAEFVKVDQDMIFDLILAANYLNIKNLLDLTVHAIADVMRGKTPEEIRQIFNIKNDFTPEEEAQVRRDNAWAFE